LRGERIAQWLANDADRLKKAPLARLMYIVAQLRSDYEIQAVLGGSRLELKK